MSFRRIKTINGNRYLYEETRYREGGKVKSRSRYIGVFTGVMNALSAPLDAIVSGLEQFRAEPGSKSYEEWEEAAKAKLAEAALPAPSPGSEPLLDTKPADEPAHAEPSQPSEQSETDAPASEPSSEPGLPDGPSPEGSGDQSSS